MQIIFEDEQVLVVRKSAGIASQSGKVGEPDLVSMAKNALFQKNKEKTEPYLAIINRLDQPVEGLVLFAKTPYAAKNLTAQMGGQGMEKYYLAVACGDVAEGLYTDTIKRDRKTGRAVLTNAKDPEGKQVRLTCHVRSRLEGLTLIQIELHTGRYHQIRVQLAARNAPLWGDVKYNPAFAARRGVVPALCAYRLIFLHPKSKERMQFEIKPSHPAFLQFL